MSLNICIDVNISDNHKYLTGDVVCIKSNHK